MNKDKAKKPYLADVEVGDKLYNFLRNNEEYEVKRISEDTPALPIVVVSGHIMTHIRREGTELEEDKVPYYLYQPVKVLDTENLPERPWTPKKGEWIWAYTCSEWKLCKYNKKLKGHRYEITTQRGNTFLIFEIAPFEGELPPGLEEEEGDYE